MMKSWYRPQDLAEALDEPVQNIYRWIERGQIRAIRCGWKIKISEEEYRKILSRGTSHVIPVRTSDNQ